MVVRYDLPNLLVSTKGHPFDRAAFFDLFDSLAGWTWTHVEQPATPALMTPEAAAPFAALVFYDVPGLRFRTPKPPEFLEPSPALVEGFERLLEAGKPMLFLHHAIAGWPTWDRYAQAIGARFFYQPGSYRGREHADSGYDFPVTYTARACGAHPVTEGLERFELTDELYLFEMLEEVVPLLRADHPFAPERFHSAANALEGRMWTRDGWAQGPGTDLVAWANRAGNAPILAIQPGNDGATFANPAYRRLIAQAVGWLTSPEAAAWAREGRA